MVRIAYFGTDGCPGHHVIPIAFEPLKKQESYLGKRKKRGLFQSSIGKLINADINGSIGIARKVIGDSFIGKIIDSGFVFNPIRVNTL